MTSTLSSFLLSTASVAIGVVAKSMWDRALARQDELARLRRSKKLEILERQLSEFYWPLYSRLQKDELVWEKVWGHESKTNLSPDVRRQLENNLIRPNHEKILEIIETKIHLARANEQLAAALSAYIRHIAIYRALRAADIYDTDPYHLGEPFPADFLKLVADEKDWLQQEYDKLLDLERATDRKP